VQSTQPFPPPHTRGGGGGGGGCRRTISLNFGLKALPGLCRSSTAQPASHSRRTRTRHHKSRRPNQIRLPNTWVYLSQPW
jgi:hypothetical protein